MKVKEHFYDEIMEQNTDDYGAFERYTKGEALQDEIERLEFEVKVAKEDLKHKVKEYNKLSAGG